METLRKFNEKKMQNNPPERLLSKFFKLKNTYLSFIDCNDDNDDNGTNNEKYLIVNASNGKSKVSISQFSEDLKMLKPNVAVLPYEYVSTI